MPQPLSVRRATRFVPLLVLTTVVEAASDAAQAAQP
jgi:hypothetical protein